jgi:GDP-L-fucose synthase
LLRKAHEAKLEGRKVLEVWGSGNVRREFLHVDDCADGMLFVLENYSGYSHVNLGSGVDVTIKELAQLISQVVGFEGDLIYDKSKPDGTPRKLLDTTEINKLGWKSQIPLLEGLRESYSHYISQ